MATNRITELGLAILIDEAPTKPISSCADRAQRRREHLVGINPGWKPPSGGKPGGGWADQKVAGEAPEGQRRSTVGDAFLFLPTETKSTS